MSNAKFATAPNRKTNWKVYIVTITVNIASLSAGIAYGWSTPAIPKLNGSVEPENNPLGNTISKVEESWISSLVPLGAAFSPFLYGILTEKIGRKRTLIGASLPLGIAFIILAFTERIYYFFIARIMCGIGLGGIYTVLPMYVAEIAEISNRGAIGCFLPTTVALGIEISYCIGPYLDFVWFNLLSGLPIAVFLACIYFVPESPHYLLSKNNSSDAEISLRSLRYDNLDAIKMELSAIKKSISESSLNKGKLSDFWTQKGLKVGIILIIGLMIFQQLTGIAVVIAHLQTIFDDANVDISSELAVIIVGFIQLLSSISSSFLVDRVGRRILLLSSIVGSFVSQCTMGIYFLLKSKGMDLEPVSWLPIFVLVIFITLYNVGLAPIPWVLVGEMFPQSVKSIASTIATFTCLISAFSLMFLYPILSSLFGAEVLFLSFSICCVLGFFFLYFTLPETKGKSFTEIQEMLNK